jgi:hypothetical protein
MQLKPLMPSQGEAINAIEVDVTSINVIAGTNDRQAMY